MKSKAGHRCYSMSHSRQRFKAVLFDLDETLIDAQRGLSKAYLEVAEALKRFLEAEGIRVNEASLRRKLQVLDNEMNRKVRYVRDDWWQELTRRVGVDIVLPDTLIHRLTAIYWRTYARFSRPYKDTLSTLRYLKDQGYRLGLISDTDGAPGLKAKRIGRLSFRSLFEVVVVAGEDTEKTKPSPGPFLLAAEKLNLPVDRCLYVGDKPFTDIKGAKTAGMGTILIKRRNWRSTVKADYTLKTLSELRLML